MIPVHFHHQINHCLEINLARSVLQSRKKCKGLQGVWVSINMGEYKLTLRLSLSDSVSQTQSLRLSLSDSVSQTRRETFSPKNLINRILDNRLQKSSNYSVWGEIFSSFCVSCVEIWMCFPCGKTSLWHTRGCGLTSALRFYPQLCPYLHGGVERGTGGK